MLTFSTYLLLILVLGNLLSLLMMPAHDFKEAFQQAMETGVIKVAIFAGLLIQLWGLAALFALKARWPEWALVWGIFWWLGVMDQVHQIRLVGAWKQGLSEAGSHLNGRLYRSWMVLNQLAVLAAAVAVLWPKS